MTATSGDLARFANPRYSRIPMGGQHLPTKSVFKRANQDNWDLTERSIHWWYIYSSTRFCPFELGVGIRGTVNLGATTWTTCDSLRPSDSPNQVRHRSSAVSIKRLKNSTFSSVSKHFFQTQGNKWRNKHHSLKGPTCRSFCWFFDSS